jgi:molybdate/tungstate transport system ATP-binding protein
MLEIRALTTSYPGFEFGPVDLTVDREVLAVLGPSGSGKSTLLSLVAGIVTPDAGTVTLDGRSLVGRPLETRRVGVVFQDGALFPHMTGRENVAYAATSRERVSSLVEMLEIGSVLDRRPAALSGGERQRVALARTLAADPDALLLDEPLSSLDTPIRRRLRDQLHDLFASLDIPVVYVTHDQQAATVLGDRLAVINDGRLEQVGTTADILDRPTSEFVARFTGSENLFEARVTSDDRGKTLRAGNLVVRVDTARPVGTSVTACIRPSRIRFVDASEGDDTAATATVTRCLNEGDEYRATVGLSGCDVELTARVRRHTVEELGIQPGATVHVVVDPTAAHVLD